MSLITKNDCMSVTELNHAVRYLCHVVEVCSKLLKVFHDYCLLTCLVNQSLELSLVASDRKTKRNILLRTALLLSSTFASKSHSNIKKTIECMTTESA